MICVVQSFLIGISNHQILFTATPQILRTPLLLRYFVIFFSFSFSFSFKIFLSLSLSLFFLSLCLVGKKIKGKASLPVEKGKQSQNSREKKKKKTRDLVEIRKNQKPGLYLPVPILRRPIRIQGLLNSRVLFSRFSLPILFRFALFFFFFVFSLSF